MGTAGYRRLKFRNGFRESPLFMVQEATVVVGQRELGMPLLLFCVISERLGDLAELVIGESTVGKRSRLLGPELDGLRVVGNRPRQITRLVSDHSAHDIT